ncbi:MAG TPA: cupin domain-containing protein [Vicinamibacterales bacterium]|nr:cupin domain-containing protein [Vicinamibacterales bacterium]
MKNVRTLLTTIGVVCIVCAGAVAAQHAHVIQAPAEAQWGPAPPMLPAGASIAVLAGDPTKAAPYTIRLKFPANYAIPAHSHPTDEHVVVTTGSLTFGMGDKLVKGTGTKTLGVGGFALMPANMNHFAYTTNAETTIVLYGQGPVEFKYVNPSDDPRNARTKTTR